MFRKWTEATGTKVIRMPTVSEILEVSDIRGFLEKNDGAKEAITRAAGQLVDEHDAIFAVRKVLNTLSNKTIPVFFSYKKKDEEAAKAVVKTLRKYSAGKLDITYQADFTEEVAGKLWRDKIRQAIHPANWFILLLPDPSDEWDWCLFETGLFVARRSSSDRLICLHHPDTKIPSQIEDYHGVATTEEELENFLRMVYLNPDAVPGMDALNKDVEENIPEIATEIMNAVRPPRKYLAREIFEPWVEMRVENPDLLNSMDDLDPAEILTANQAALELFGFLKKPGTFGTLRRDIVEEGNDSRWRNELFHVIRRIATDRRFSPVQAVFKSPGGTLHRPLTAAVDRVGEDGPIKSFHISFTEEISAVDRSSMPADLSMLADLLRFVFRFRWEVLEPYSKSSLTEIDLNRLDKALKRIKADWHSRHVGDDQDLFSMFSEEHQIHFASMSEKWNEISNDEGTGKLDLALKTGEKEIIPSLLKEFLPMNQEFLQIAAGRFSDLISGKS